MSIRRVKALVAGVIAAAALMLPAVAQADEPAEGYSQFAGCPSPSEDPAVIMCTHSVVTGGHFKMGSKNVPIANPIELDGGLHADGTVGANSLGGLKPVRQPVPGGVIGITGLDWLINYLSVDALKLYAVTELAGEPQFLGGNLKLPIKVHLENPALGSECYVGSDSNPISLDLTVGTTNPPPPNEPITGQVAEVEFDAATKILHQRNGIFVDNAFAAPGANGCVLNVLGLLPIDLDGLVNVQAGLPSPAGTNETVQNFELESVPPAVVYP